jgi:hypothetical protein
MIAATPIRRYATLSSARAGLWLIIAFPLAVACVFLADQVASTDLTIEHPAFLLAFIPPYALAGGLWGRSLGRSTGYLQTRQFILAGAVGVALPTAGALIALNAVEQDLARFLRTGLPIHIIFALAFALTALMLAGCAGLALGLSVGKLRLAAQLALGSGLAGGLTFLAVDLGMDLLGFRVGAPAAEERATMLVVSILGLWATAIVGSAVIGRILARDAAQQALPSATL